MNRISVTVFASIALLSMLVSCSTTNSIYDQEVKKDEYLKSNYPAKKDGGNTNTPVKTTFDR